MSEAPPPTNPPSALEQRLVAIATAIETARDSVQQGSGVDLTALEAEVRDVCAEITGATALENRDRLETAIRAVLGDLDALAESLADQHRRAMAAAGLNDAARTAYGAPQTGNNEPENGGGDN